ncbi:MAG: ABC transporter permease [Candidatus Moranbacteria bacterium]|nr:ABC transporter permease [Candidatus Moranbacteria bacterium]
MHEIVTSIKLALNNLRANVGRTTLSILGIVIGVVAVIVVLSFGLGVKGYIVGQIEAFGTDIIALEVKVPQVSKTSTKNIQGSSSGSVTTLKIEDIEAVGKLSNVAGWYAASIGQAIASYGPETKQTMLYATTSQIFDIDQQTKFAGGVGFTDEEDKSLDQVIVLGSAVKTALFADENPVGKNIKLKGANYRVIGYLQERGATGFFNFDELAYVPMRTYQKKIAGIDYVQSSVIKMKDKAQTDATIDEANGLMRQRHKITDPNKDDFAITSITEVAGILDKVFLIVNALLLSLTSISLIVGGVGIMNVMYVSVTERTAEIGLRKAVGAKNSIILKQFLFEAIFITVIGGLVGIALGAGLAFLASKVAHNFGFAVDFVVSGYSVLLGVGFSVVTGVLFGLYPARKASLLSPMEALRKE